MGEPSRDIAAPVPTAAFSISLAFSRIDDLLRQVDIDADLLEALLLRQPYAAGAAEDAIIGRGG